MTSGRHRIVWEGSSLSGAGTITPNAEEENYNPTPIRARDMMNGNGSANEDAKAAVAEQFNTLVRREDPAASGADFAAANEANSGYDAIIILNDKTCDLDDLTEKTEFTPEQGRGRSTGAASSPYRRG